MMKIGGTNYAGLHLDSQINTETTHACIPL